MNDINDIRERPEAYQAACAKKFIKFDISAFLELDKEYRELKTQTEIVRAEQNKASKEISSLKGADKESRLAEMKELSARVKQFGEKLSEVEARWIQQQLLIPAIPLDRVPVGKDDKENVEIKRWGEIPKFSFKPKDHVQLGRDLDILDIERGVKLAGARSYFLKGDGVRLQHAAINFALDHLHAKGYTLMDVPHIVNYDCMKGTGFFPGAEENAYHLDERDDKYLIGTAEVPVTSYHMGEILDINDLPKRYAGYSPCYRREAGTYGKDTQGVYRIHQFFKVEQVILCEADPEKSMKMHQEILGNAEELLQAFKLPYRVVDDCTGDMGQGQVFKNDIECWMPSRENFGETHSCSSFYEFQARRLNIKYKDKDGKNRICYTLNNTLIATPRILIPLLEIYQNVDGSVTIPEVLRPYMRGQERIVAPKKG